MIKQPFITYSESTHKTIHSNFFGKWVYYAFRLLQCLDFIYVQKIVFNTALCGSRVHFYKQKQLNALDRKAKCNTKYNLAETPKSVDKYKRA